MLRIKISENHNLGYQASQKEQSFPLSIAGKVADFCFRSKIFNILTLAQLHTFIHELGHAVAHIILSGGRATIRLSTKSCYGETLLKEGRPVSQLGDIWIHLSGPLANLIFSVVLVVGIFALTHYVSMPYGLSLSLRIWGGFCSAGWILIELAYATVSSSQKDHGDFGKIAQNGQSHLLVSFAALLAVTALGAVGVAMLI